MLFFKKPGSDFCSLRDGILVGAVTFGVVIVSIAFLTIYAWRSQVELVREEVGRMAAAAAGLVDGDKHQLLRSDADTDSVAYAEMIDPLVRMHQRVPDVAYLYTFVERDGRLHFGLDTATRKEALGFSREMQASRVMEPYESDSPEMDQIEARVVREGVPYVHEDATTDAFGSFLTALAPIFNSQGRAVAAIGLDLDVSHLNLRLLRLRTAAISAAGIGAILSGLVGLIVWRLRHQAISAKSAHRDESEARFEAEFRQSRLIQALSEIVYHHDLKTDEVTYVGRCEALLGLKPSEMGRNSEQWIEQIHPGDREGVAEHFSAAKRNRQLFNIEYRFRRADGGYVWISDRAVITFDSQDEPETMDGVMVNVQDRKAVEEQLRTVFESSTNPHILLTDGLIRNCNAAAVRLLECVDKSELIGFPIFRFLQENQPDGLRASDLWDSAVAKAGDGAPHRFELVVKMNAEDLSIFEVSISRVYIEGNESILSVWQDLTRIKAAQSELIIARDRAESANRAKTEFLAVMSHEIRTPLNGVLGFSDLLAQTRLDEDQVGYLRTITSCGGSLLSLINDILDFSRMESGRLELEAREFDLYACVQSALEIHAGSAFAKGVELLTSLDPSLPRFVVGDEQRLRQVFLNLVGNAVKFTGSGEVMVRGRSHAETAENVVRLDFEIEDTGIGIDSASLPKLFEPFAQADSSMSRRYGGAGLGLVISSRLVKRMGGSISVKSREGLGSVFAFSVILARAANRVPRPDTDGMILIGSHNQKLGDALIESLKNLGLTVSEAPTTGSGHPAATLVATSEWIQRHPDFRFLALANVIRLRPLGLAGDSTDGVNTELTRPVFLPALISAISVGNPRGNERMTPAMPIDDLQQTDFPSFDSLRVLIVEDNSINQKLMLRMHRQFGITSTLATSGIEAIRICQEQEFDLIFMDIQMPGLDGFETTRRLRSAGCPSWIVALTAHAMSEDRERCLSAGMNEFLSKPMRLESLRRVLQTRAATGRGSGD